MSRRARFPIRCWPAGFSLVELMVAMLLSLILSGAILQVYLVNKRTFVSQDQNAQVQEAGRYAVEFMARDLRMAGLLGCGSRSQPDRPLQVKNYLKVTGFPYDVQIGIRGFEAPGSAPGASLTLTAIDPLPVSDGTGWSPALPASLAGQVLPGSDVVVVSGIAPESWPLVSPFTSGAQIFVAVPNSIARGDVLMVTDCNQAQIFQASSVNASSSNVTGAPASMTPGNTGPIAAQGPRGPFGDGSQVSRVRSYAYYLGRGIDGSPSLIRESLQSTSTSASTLVREELINHVEALQITYGIDGDGDFVVDRYAPASAATDWAQVRAVRLGLLLRSPQEILPQAAAGSYAVDGVAVTAPNDRRQRRVFPLTVSLRNRLP